MSDSSQSWSPDEVIANLLAINEQTWGALERLGVTEQTQLRLHFDFEGEDEAARAELAGFLERETDYEVEVVGNGVTGATQPRTVDLAILNDWVRWMVLAGYEHGGCKFDGWDSTIHSP
jgi:hypothetical protein